MSKAELLIFLLICSSQSLPHLSQEQCHSPTCSSQNQREIISPVPHIWSLQVLLVLPLNISPTLSLLPIFIATTLIQATIPPCLGYCSSLPAAPPCSSLDALQIVAGPAAGAVLIKYKSDQVAHLLQTGSPSLQMNARVLPGTWPASRRLPIHLSFCSPLTQFSCPHKHSPTLAPSYLLLLEPSSSSCSHGLAHHYLCVSIIKFCFLSGLSWPLCPILQYLHPFSPSILPVSIHLLIFHKGRDFCLLLPAVFQGLEHC